MELLSLLQQLPSQREDGPVPPHILGARVAAEHNREAGNARALALLSDTEWRTADQMAKQSMSSAMTVKHMMKRLKARGLAVSMWDGKRYLWRKA